jgi:flagellar biosynthesis regulator FlaF
LHFDKSVITNECQRFASSFYYETDTNHLYDIIEYIQRLGITEVRIESQALYSNTLYKELRTKLIESGIDILTQNELKDLGKDEYPILLSFKTRKYFPHYSTNASKIVAIKNSTPVDIK